MGELPIQFEGELRPQTEEYNYVGVLFMSERRRMREAVRQIGAASVVMLFCHGKARAQLKGEAIDFTWQSAVLPSPMLKSFG